MTMLEFHAGHRPPHLPVVAPRGDSGSAPRTAVVRPGGAAPVDLAAVADTADLAMYLTLIGAAVAALAIGAQFDGLATAALCAIVLLAIGSAAFFMARGTVFSRYALTASNVAMVALHIQLGRGTIEFHFGVFVLLGLLLVYRDWRPLVVGAALFAVHHVLFDRLQAMGIGVYCTPEPNFLKVVMHAVYVIVQTGVELALAISLRTAAVEAAELSALIRTVDRGDRLCLDVTSASTTAPASTMLKAVLVKIESAIADVSVAASSIEASSLELASGNVDLRRRTEEQARNLESAAASMEELTETLKNTSETAAQANDLASSASNAAAHGGKAVGKVVSTMSDISQSSVRIADITAVIDGIAFQTNILALNAAVEAARAGEQGRGFAVVAAEVRSLAQRSADAAKEIKSLIGESVQKVGSGMDLVHAAGGSMDEIVDQARRVSELIGEISSATSEQTIGISQVRDAVTELDSVTKQNAELVNDSAVAGENLRGQAVRLNAVVSRFQLAPRRSLAAA